MPLAREQRKLAAIVAADVVGYSRLMGRDESGTLARLRKNRSEHLDPVLAKYGGRLVKLTGDGALIEFASAVDALSAAIEFQQARVEANGDQPAGTALVFRIGLHVGDLIVDGDDLYGDSVNVAARLEGEAPAGGILISSNVRDAVAGRLKATFEDLGSLALKNIERPIQAFSVKWDPSDWQLQVTSEVAVAPMPSQQSPLPLPDKPSIAVLPFQNMSGDPEQEYFADGVVEDIVTALSNFRSLFVIARNSSFTYKGKTVDVKQVGRELGVRYVLEGSVRKAAGRVRITGQLIEASTGTHLWAEKIDGELREIFDLQDHITTRVVSSVTPTIDRAEIERLKQRSTTTTTSYDWYLRGLALTYQRKFAEARSLFKKATEQNPEYAAAYASSALTYSQEQAVYGIIPTPEMRADALQDAQAALGITSEDAVVLARCAHPMAYICHQFDRGMWLADRAVVLNENVASGWNSRGWISLMVGKPEQAIESFEMTLRLSPLDPARPYSLSGIAFGRFFLGRYDEGRRVAKEILQIFPHHQSFATYIINCVGAGDLAEAKSAAAEFLKFDPVFSVSRASEIYPTKPAYRTQIDDALRAAGLPE
jgi:adenylate cyclase